MKKQKKHNRFHLDNGQKLPPSRLFFLLLNIPKNLKLPQFLLISLSFSPNQQFSSLILHKQTLPSGAWPSARRRHYHHHYHHHNHCHNHKLLRRTKNMGDPTAIFPYHDPYDDINTLEQILMSDENPSLSLTEFSSFQQPISCNPLISQSGDEEIVDANDPLIDPFIWDLCSHEDGPSRMQEETNGQEREGCSDYKYNTQCYRNMGSPIQLSMWPLPAVPYTCTCCQVLREITHTNGIYVKNILQLESSLCIFLQIQKRNELFPLNPFI